MLYVFVLFSATLCLAVPARAAVVNYDSGTAGYVVGNDGLGVVISPPVNNANASGNTVNITGGTINNGIYGGIHSATTGNDVSIANNQINVGPAFVGNSNLFIYGGFARAQISGSATSLGNVVNINGGLAREIFGGYAGSVNGPATADNNTVTFTAGEALNIYGGQALINATTVYGASASGNRVVISGGKISTAAYGGFVTRGTGSSATNNTVTIMGSPDLANAALFGGFASSAPVSDIWSGNTLEIKTAGISVKQISNFQYLHFYVPASVGDQDTLLTVTGTANVAGSTIRVGMSGSGSPLQIGDTITLISAGTLSGTPANNGGVGLGIQGISKIFTFEISADNNTDKVQATVLSVDEAGGGGQADTQLKALDESRMAGLGLLSQSQYMLDAQVMPQLRALPPQIPYPVAFGTLGGGAMRYDSGSHVDVESLNLLAGFGWNAALDERTEGRLLLGVFAEGGWGVYDTYNSFGGASIRADGNVSHYGGGVFARYDTAPLDFSCAASNFYLEASVRAGQVETDYKSSDFLTASGNNVSFTSSAAYYGAHAGLGYLWSITEKNTLDLYTKYLWTRQNGDSVFIEGDTIRFRRMDSHRWRTGARINNALGAEDEPVFTQYAGAAYEYEFDSRAEAYSNGNPISAPTVKGGTGIGEFGFAVAPSAASSLSVDLGVQFYIGRRTGAGGSLQAKWTF